MFSLSHHANLDLSVLKQLLQVTALLTKRGWFDAADTNSDDMNQGENALSPVLSQLPKLLAAGVESQIVGGRLLSMLTDEFSFTRASAVGLAWEQHLHSRVGFEQVALPQVFSEVVKMLGQHERMAAEFNVPSRKSVYNDWMAVWLATLTTILTWEFEQDGGQRDLFSLPPRGVETEPALLQPGLAWRNALTDGRLVELLLSIASTMLKISDPDIASRPRQALLALCNLDGAIFSTKQTRTAFHSDFLLRVLVWLNTAVAVAVSAASMDEELVAGQVTKVDYCS